jgi:putative transposase
MKKADEHDESELEDFDDDETDADLDDDEGYLDDMFAERHAEHDAMVDDLLNDRGVISLCFFHLYFSTTGQQPLFDDEAIRGEVQHELERVCKRTCCPAFEIAVGREHAHLVCRLHPELSLDGLVTRFKSDTQAYLNTHHPELGENIWQESYGGYTVDGPGVSELREYLTGEANRHLLETYEDEFRRLCAENGIDIEEPDCWQ